MNKEKTSLLRSDGFQTLLSSLACILGGLILGYLVLLVITSSFYLLNYNDGYGGRLSLSLLLWSSFF